MYRVFLSSPADVTPERDRAQAVLERLNAEHPGSPLFTLTRWEERFYLANAPFQDQILAPGEHDLVVFIFWKRLGTELSPKYNRADGTSRTGTEYEFEEALGAREHRTDQLPDVLVYRKNAPIFFDEEFVDLQRAQKKSFDQFWERWFRSEAGHLIAGFQTITDADHFEREFERNVREWLERRHAGQSSWSIRLQGSPFRGLQPFDEAHASLFFGRAADMARGRALFIEAAVGQQSGRRGTPFLLILGPSGSGKSSFMRAGLVPRMRSGGVPAFLEDCSDAIHVFRTLVITPSEIDQSLCNGLAVALYRPARPAAESEVGLPELAAGDYPSAEQFAALAARSPEFAAAPILRALERAAAQSVAVDSAGSAGRRFGLLLAIDQLEELFARPESDRQQFVRLLAALTATDRIWVVATMRNDFYDRFRQDVELAGLADGGSIYNLAPPALSDFRDIIRMPAHAAGLKFETNESRDLAAEIEAEAGSEGVLPMIAYLLEQLFQTRRGDLLTLASYDQLGGAAGALATQGEQLFAAFPPEVQHAFPAVVRRLVRKSLQDLVPTAAKAPLSAFPPGSPERALVGSLTQARLVRMFTTRTDANSTTHAWVRLSHEALISRWPRLRLSVDADRRDYETLDRVQSAYLLWQSTPEPQRHERLMAGLALAEGEDLAQRWGSDVDAPLRRFVEESRLSMQAGLRRRRNVVTATVTALSVLLLIATTAGFIAFKQSILATREQTAADTTTRFMVSLFQSADPGKNRGNSITVREMLDKGAGEVTKGMEQDPRVRADLLTAMGQAYMGLGLYGPAKELLAQARDDQSVAEGPDESHVRTLVALGTTLYLAADYTGAEKTLRGAVNLARRSLPVEDVLRSEALASLAEVLVQLERYPEAKQLCQEALAVDRKRGPKQAATLARTLDALGRVYYYSDDLTDAEKTMREELAIYLKAGDGAPNVSIANAMGNLGAVLFQAGHYDDSMKTDMEALPIYRHVWGNEHPEVAVLLCNIGLSALMAGHIDKAEPWLRQALAMDEKLKDQTHDDLVMPLNGLAMIDGYAGQLNRAQSEVQRAEQIARLPNHGELLYEVLLNAIDISLRTDGHADVSALLTEARGRLESRFPLATHPGDAWRYAILDTVDAEVLAAKGDRPSARRMISMAMPIIEQRFGPLGFFSLLARRRMQFVEATIRSESKVMER